MAILSGVFNWKEVRIEAVGLSNFAIHPKDLVSKTFRNSAATGPCTFIYEYIFETFKPQKYLKGVGVPVTFELNKHAD